jgi:hypothetical protein
VAGIIRSTEKSDDLTGNQTHHIAACSIVPQPTTQYIQEIQGICRRASDRPSDQSSQPGHLSHLDSLIITEVKKLQLRPAYME